MSYRPPLSKAKSVAIDDNQSTESSGNIVAIDFGTTSVSLAYVTKGDEKINTFSFGVDDKVARVPNAFLLERGDDHKISVVAFGNNAKTKFSSLKRGSQDLIYFERIKMLMKRSKV